MEIQIQNLNIWMVAVAGLVYYILGALWYSPLLFAKPWMKLNGYTEQDFQDINAARYIAAFFTSMIMSFVLAQFITHLGNGSIISGIGISLWVWVGFIGTFTLTNYMFSNRPVKLFMIDSGYNLVGLLIMSVIISAWK